MTRQPQLTSSLRRLLDLFNEIEDGDIREVISDVVAVESRFRSSAGKNFPMREVRDVIDRVVRLQEESEKEESHVV